MFKADYSAVNSLIILAISGLLLEDGSELLPGQQFKVEGKREVFVFRRVVADGNPPYVECFSTRTGHMRSLLTEKVEVKRGRRILRPST